LIYENIVLISEIKDIGFSTYRLSNDIRQKYRLSFWDSLIIASALENNCLTLYSEDMQDGQIIEDRLKIINPFKGQGE
jgi:predicted nucleic acid-binding protein